MVAVQMLLVTRFTALAPVVRVGGEIDLSTAPHLGAHLRDLIAAGNVTIVVDATDISFMDSSAVRVLCDAHLALVARGGRLSIANPAPGVARILHLCGMTEIIEVHDSIDLALRQVG